MDASRLGLHEYGVEVSIQMHGLSCRSDGKVPGLQTTPRCEEYFINRCEDYKKNSQMRKVLSDLETTTTPRGFKYPYVFRMTTRHDRDW